MADVRPPMSLPNPDRLPDDHASHDRQLVVAFASGDLPTEELADARALVARCRRCAALVTDVETIARAVREDAWTPPRPRDFRITADDALRLRGGLLSRLARRVTGPGQRILQPLAGAAVAIGLVLMVATTVMPSVFMASGAAPAPVAGDATLRQAGEGTDGGAGAAPGAEAPAAEPELFASPGPAAASAAANDLGGTTDTSRAAAEMETVTPVTSPLDPVIPVGAGLVVVGIVLLVILAIARRATKDPLLR